MLKKFWDLEKKDRLIFFLMCTAIGNFVIAVVKFVFAVTIPSLWFAINALFGFVISVARFWTVRDYRQVRFMKDEDLKRKFVFRNYLKNGIMLILLGIVYFFISSYMYFKGTNTTMHEYITYLVALIAFSSIGTAIYGMVKYKKNHEPIMKAVKLTNFANALTSIVLTQVVLLDTFAGGYDSRVNGYTGMGVSLMIMCMGLYMILGIQKYIGEKRVS